jgi:hypothetical protein
VGPENLKTGCLTGRFSENENENFMSEEDKTKRLLNPKIMEDS